MNVATCCFWVQYIYPDKEQMFIHSFADLFLTFIIFRIQICRESYDAIITLIKSMKELKVSRFRLCLFVLIPVLFSVPFTEFVPIRECCYWWAVFLLDPIVSPAIWFNTMTMRKRHGRSSQVSISGLCFFFFFFCVTWGLCASRFYDGRKLFLWMTLTQVNFHRNEGKEFPKSFR